MLNPEPNREACRNYYNNNREVLIALKKKYNHNNLENWRNIDLYRRDTDLNYRLRKNLRSRMRSAIMRNTKTGSAIDDLGCSIDALKTHLETQFHAGMYWDNWPEYWHIDHIMPLQSFDLTNRDEFLKAVHYTNLQPLLVEDHRRKSAAERLLYSLGEK